jgi:tRNA threonylcarbamoyladenosine biosynthesis protein TsaB
MILIISTIGRNIIELGLSGDKTQIFQYETDDQSRDLLVKTNELLKDEKLTLSDIKAIAVNRGPGSFTGVRVGITTANTLAWSLDILVIGYLDGKLEDGLNNIIEKKFSKIVLPFYDK